jgi:mRNA interferase MazF
MAISRFDYNRKAGLALFCPITFRAKGFPYEVSLPSGLGIEGVVLCDQIKSMDWTARRYQRAGRAPDSIVADVLAVASSMLR